MTGWENTVCLQCNAFKDTASKGRMSDYGCLCADTTFLVNFPGLVQEYRKLLTKYDLPNIIEETRKLAKNQWTNIVR